MDGVTDRFTLETASTKCSKAAEAFMVKGMGKTSKLTPFTDDEYKQKPTVSRLDVPSGHMRPTDYFVPLT